MEDLGQMDIYINGYLTALVSQTLSEADSDSLGSLQKGTS